MFGFWGLIVAFFGCLLGGVIWLRYKAKTFPNATVLDTEMWKLQMITTVLGFVIIIFSGSSSFVHYRPSIGTNDTPEEKIEKLIENDKKRSEAAERSGDVSFLLFLMVGGSLTAIGDCIAKIHKARDLQLLSENPEIKKPLGLS